MRADLALVGFGHVGRRFARLLEERRDWLSLDYDLNCRVVGIATRRHGRVFAQAGAVAVAAAGRIPSCARWRTATATMPRSSGCRTWSWRRPTRRWTSMAGMRRRRRPRWPTS